MRASEIADLGTHSELLKDSLGRVLNWQNIQGCKFNIKVTSGLLEGLSSEYLSSHCFIGSDPASDIILLDESVIDKHVEMDVKMSVFGPVISITALAPGVIINGSPVAPLKIEKFQNYLFLSKLVPQLSRLPYVAKKNRIVFHVIKANGYKGRKESSL